RVPESHQGGLRHRAVGTAEAGDDSVALVERDRLAVELRDATEVTEAGAADVQRVAVGLRAGVDTTGPAPRRPPRRRCRRRDRAGRGGGAGRHRTPRGGTPAPGAAPGLSPPA